VTNLVIQQGADSEIRIANVRAADGVLITNWVGYEVNAQVRERVESAVALHEWTSTGPGATATFDGSDIVLAVASATSAAWTWTSGRYDVELTNPDDEVARIAEGHLTVSREVTR
jgi:hypothetical protein